MKSNFFLLIIFLLSACSNTTDPKPEESKTEIVQAIEKDKPSEKPKVSFTFDDGITNDIVNYKFEDWNEMILAALKKADIKSTFFVTASNKRNKKGKYLLNTWTEAGHQIANHTNSHPNFNNDKLTIADFEKELLLTDKVISNYDSYTKLFRFPFLKEGNTEEKVNGFRKILAKHGYKNGHVTIDASDWFVNTELINNIRKSGASNPKVEKYKAFYLAHILERAKYYEKLSFELNDRHINHTLLLHHNLTSALFLEDLIATFKKEGWEIIDADLAFKDKIFNKTPNVIPAGESLIWSLAKESGKYENELRYPAEDRRYEYPKMKKLGL